MSENDMSQEKMSEKTQDELKCPKCNCIIESDSIEDKSQFVCPNCYYEYNTAPIPTAKYTWKSPGLAGGLCFFLGSLGLLYIGFVPFITGFLCEGFCVILLIGLASSGSLDNVHLPPFSPLFLIILYKIIFGSIGWFCAKQYNSVHGLENPFKPCRKCGYNLKEVKDLACPQCGTPIT